MADPVLVVGGGIGGLAAVACLRVRGVESVVFERAMELREVGAALAVWPNASRVLREIGVLAELEKRACPAPVAHLRDWRGRVLKRSVILGTDAPTLLAHRADLHAAMLKAIAPESIQLNRTCVGIERDGERVRVKFADGEVSPWGRALIGADGINSIVRKMVLDDGPPTYRGYHAWRGVAPVDFGQEIAGETWGRGMRFGLIPLGAGRTAWWATANQKSSAVPGGREEWKKLLRERFAKWHQPIPELLDATPASAILCNPIADRPPPSTKRPWGKDNTTLLGDAAHPTTPNLGQGACMAIEDAAVLSQALAGISDASTAFRVYEATRYQRTAFIVRESLKFGSIGQWANPIACFLRDRLLPLAPDKGLQKMFHDLWTYDAWHAPLVMPGE
jgi:2-polyprenyl-6-methoxyphenol hydroxylase-like FAD-dependent oxidoreductase